MLTPFMHILTKKKLFILFLLVILPNISIAQKVKVKKILDSNLFELTDGRLIKLAGVDVPNINHKDTSLREVGMDAFQYANRVFVNKRFELTYPKPNTIDTNFTLVYIIKDYPFFTRNFTIEYLERGFGKFLNNGDTTYINEFLQADDKAKIGKEGIWEYYDSYNFLLDKSITNLDTNFTKQLLQVRTFKNSFANTPPFTRILMQLVIGPVAGGLFALPGAGIEILFSDNSSCGHPCIQGIFGAYIGYLIGTSTWTYFAGGGKDRNLSYPMTLLSGTAGVVLHSVIALYLNKYNIVWYSLFLSPIIAEIIYTNLAGTNSIENIDFTNNPIPNKYCFTHQDYYNSTKIFEMNLFRINF